MSAIELGAAVRRAREDANLSYRDVRERSGLALGHLQRIERGQVADPSPATLRKLAGALDVSYERLLSLAGVI